MREGSLIPGWDVVGTGGGTRGGIEGDEGWDRGGRWWDSLVTGGTCRPSVDVHAHQAIRRPRSAGADSVLESEGGNYVRGLVGSGIVEWRGGNGMIDGDADTDEHWRNKGKDTFAFDSWPHQKQVCRHRREIHEQEHD